ncbi:MAG: tetratricopeptide repeat protein, partial [Saprospiraceae bacterium]|nr:tetratricopeptide repeat protein [Saprospiraceae bacterium]
FLQPNLAFEFHYFSGLALRLRMDAEGYVPFQFEKALQEELHALEIDNRSPCVHNELGILYQQKKDYQKAEQYYKTAIELAPQWAVPWANLCGLYALTNQLDDCMAAGEKALELHPKLFLATINLGVGMVRKKNLLYAESYFQQAIAVHPNHFFAHEQLGLICIQRMKYPEAAAYLKEAEYLKRGTPQIQSIHAYVPSKLKAPAWEESNNESLAMVLIDSITESALLKRIAQNPDDKQAQFDFGKYCRERFRFELAKKHYKLAIAIDTVFVEALDSLGRLASLLKQWEEAEACFIQIWNLLPLDSTLDKEGQRSYKVLLQAYLAKGYEQQRRYDRLENAYLTLIELEPEKQHFENLWNLYEQLGRWNDSERTIERMIQKNGANHKEALNHFYERVISRFPDDLAWKYQYMTVLYEEARYPKEFQRQEPDDSRCVALLEELILKETDVQRVDDLREKLGNLNMKAINQLERIIENPGLDPEEHAANVIQLKNLKTKGFNDLEALLASYPEHADLRYKLINLYVGDWNYKKALEHLDSLYTTNQIDLPRRTLLAEYSVLTNRFERGEQVLEECVNIAPYVPANMEALFGLFYMLRGDAPKAVSFFENLIRKGGSTWEHQYALARAQAAAGTRDAALKTLATASSADEYGSLNIILKYDPVWDTFRNDPTWIKLQK